MTWVSIVVTPPNPLRGVKSWPRVPIRRALGMFVKWGGSMRLVLRTQQVTASRVRDTALDAAAFWVRWT